MIDLLRRLDETLLDWATVGLGEVIEHVAFLMADAALNGDLVPEHLADRFAQGFGAVDREQHSLLDIEPARDEV